MLKYVLVAHFERKVGVKIWVTYIIGRLYRRVLNLWHVFLKHEYPKHNGNHLESGYTKKYNIISKKIALYPIIYI